MRYLSMKKEKDEQHCPPSLAVAVSDDGLEPPTYTV
jgi:hypothetical protein